MPTTREEWLRTSALPDEASYDAMLEFFGIPPYSQDRLDANIAKKRRDWYAKTSSGNPHGRERARQVVALIQRVSEALKRGTAGNFGGAAAQPVPPEVLRALEDLWPIVSEYVFADDYDQALQVARTAVERWPGHPQPFEVLAWVVATGQQSTALAHAAVLREGLYAAERATSAVPNEPRNWECLMGLLMALGRVGEAVTVSDRARDHLTQGHTARMCLLRARALLATNRVDDALVAAVHAVQAASDPYAATAVRSQLTTLLADWAGTNLLPIRSPDMLRLYVEVVGTAAWCSYGVPEAEDLVRVHRMWAVNAGRRVFTGSLTLRSFLAVCTGFISLPMHNRLRSEQAWWVLLCGLERPELRDDAFWFVAAPMYVQRAHNVRLS